MNAVVIEKMLESAKISQRSHWVLQEIFINGRSVEDLAKEKDVTRPRMRSILMKALRDFFGTVGSKALTPKEEHWQRAKTLKVDNV
jgi:DNA-directed RNA polymerase sigma subunit (sigma70/sigma32)